jgi:hypothetical protein
MEVEMKTKPSSERGQALVLIALAFLVLIGFTALAIDGGMTYSDRRISQAVSDSASLAGGGLAALHLENEHIFSSVFDCNHPEVREAQSIAVNAAINSANANDFTIDGNATDANGVETVCANFDNGSYPVQYIDVVTHISQTVNTGFLHLVYDGEMINQVQATVRVSPHTPPAFGYAIVALNDANCLGHQNGVMLSGDIDVHVSGGGIFSNGGLRGNGSSLIVDVDGAPIRYESELECDPSGCPGFSPAPTHATAGDLPEDSYYIAPPDCSVYTRNNGKVTKGGTISPGLYTEIDLHSSGTSLFMEPGLYCLTGSPKAMVVSGGMLTGYNVTIYVENGEVALSGNANIVLTAPNNPDASPEIPGVLIYLAEGNTGAVELEGNSDTIFDGIIYVPDGYIEAKGVAGLTTPVNFSVQLIGHDVEIGGNADLNIIYDGIRPDPNTAKIDLWE